jgi:hypothetical protein
MQSFHVQFEPTLQPLNPVAMFVDRVCKDQDQRRINLQEHLEFHEWF